MGSKQQEVRGKMRVPATVALLSSPDATVYNDYLVKKDRLSIFRFSDIVTKTRDLHEWSKKIQNTVKLM